jgi:hypothetical protein
VGLNNIYDHARYQLLTAGIDWRTVPLVLSVWGDEPLFDPTDKTIADIQTHGFAELGYSMTITGQAVSNDGTAQTNPVLIPGIPAGSLVTWFTFAWKNVTHVNSQLILFIDQAEGIPFEANGLDVVVQPDWLQERGWWRP